MFVREYRKSAKYNLALDIELEEIIIGLMLAAERGIYLLKKLILKLVLILLLLLLFKLNFIKRIILKIKIKSLWEIWVIAISSVQTVYFYDFYLIYYKGVNYLFNN